MQWNQVQREKCMKLIAYIKKTLVTKERIKKNLGECLVTRRRCWGSYSYIYIYILDLNNHMYIKSVYWINRDRCCKDYDILSVFELNSIFGPGQFITRTFFLWKHCLRCSCWTKTIYTGTETFAFEPRSQSIRRESELSGSGWNCAVLIILVA